MRVVHPGPRLPHDYYDLAPQLTRARRGRRREGVALAEMRSYCMRAINMGTERTHSAQ